LKHDYGLAPLRVRGLEHVTLHADLTMLARLGQALSRVRDVVPLAAYVGFYTRFMVADLAEISARQPRWVLIFIAGLALGSAWGTYSAVRRFEQFFGEDEMQLYRAAQRARLANHFAKPS